ncbi:uncharacterized protein LOC111083846 isoform X2 [Limulus polyphemus]|nr:uncharacterized protein LOC111083846 isoform X2 [Limulus polyphemus]
MKDHVLEPSSSDVGRQEVKSKPCCAKHKDTYDKEGYEEIVDPVQRAKKSKLERYSMVADRIKRRKRPTTKREWLDIYREIFKGIGIPNDKLENRDSWFSARKKPTRNIDLSEESDMIKDFWTAGHRGISEGIHPSRDESTKITNRLASKQDKVGKPGKPSSSGSPLEILEEIFEGAGYPREEANRKAAWINIHRVIFQQTGYSKEEACKIAVLLAINREIFEGSGQSINEAVRRAAWLAMHRDTLERTDILTEEAARSTAWLSLCRELVENETTSKS